MRVDRDILLFLWRWKLVSSTALAARFYPRLTSSGANMRLESLRKHKLIYPHYMNTTEAKVLWSLTTKGFREAKELLPDLKEDGFRSEHALHDFYVTAMHLGEWLDQTPDGCDTFSEQELRRMELDHYPYWIPKTNLHRPDGYWKVQLPEGDMIAALEVELKVKSDSSYGVVAQFYKDQPNVSRVVWVVRTLANAKSIRDSLSQSSPINIQIHTFILLPDFISYGWQAPIVFGFEAGEPIARLLYPEVRKSTEKNFVFSMLETRKSPAVTPCFTVSRSLSTLPLPALADAVTGYQTLNDFPEQADLPRSAKYSYSHGGKLSE